MALFIFLTLPAAVAETPAAYPVISGATPTPDPFLYGAQDLAGAWTLVNDRPGWSPRRYHSSTVLPDGSIILTGGSDGSALYRDVWRSTDNGTTWTMMTPAAGWSARHYHSSAALSDGSLVLMGGSGFGSTFVNDVWRSTDKGATWVRLPDAPWERRSALTCVVLSDDSIVIMGGASDYPYNDVWRSTDRGTTWILMNASAGWTERFRFAAVVLPDDSIVIMGGATDYGERNDVWRSADKGATWTLMTAYAGWYPRQYLSAAVLPDGSILLMGGDYRNDMWRSTDKGASWTQVTAATGMPRRELANTVTIPGGSIILTGSAATGYSASSDGDVWQFTPVRSLPEQRSGNIVISKVISPQSLKQGTDARITITVFNRGTGSIHDVEIVDTTLPEFPFINGSMQHSESRIGPNETITLTYMVHAKTPGTFWLNKTTVMYADPDGNYRISHSDYEKAVVFPSLIEPEPADPLAVFIRDLETWINEFDPVGWINGFDPLS